MKESIEKIVMLNIKTPLGDRVVIQPSPAETKTASGIYIPDSAQERPQHGTIVAAGPGRYAELTGNLIPMTVTVNDKVLYGKHAGQELEINGTGYLIMREADLFIIL